MEIDRKTFLDSLGGPEAASRMDSEARADALESHMMAELNKAKAGQGESEPTEAQKYPTAAEVEAQIETRKYREGVGFMYVPRTGENVRRLMPVPSNPALYDFFKLRFMDTSNHVLQSANLAMKNGMTEEIILACLLHDVVQEIIRTDHGWWGAQLFEPYVPEKVSFAIRYHQALRYFPDPAVGYEYPDLYRPIVRLRLRSPALYRSDLPDGAQASVVHGRATGHGKRFICIRSERRGFHRAIHRYHRTPLQTAERGARE